jgi:beta-ureidopropionase
MVMIVPVYERSMAGVYYNTAAVIDADGTYLGKYRKTTSRTAPGLLGEVLLQARQPRLPGVPDRLRKVGVYICYDRHFPEGARASA